MTICLKTQNKSNSLTFFFEYSQDEREDEFSNDDLFNIQSWGSDLSVRELISQYEDEDIL